MITSKLQILGSLCDSLAGYPTAPLRLIFEQRLKKRKGSFPRDELKKESTKGITETLCTWFISERGKVFRVEMSLFS